jgi:hypothetical protein
MDLSDVLDRPIAFQRPFVTMTGSVTAALFLSQAVYWSKRGDNGWFYKNRDQWLEETGLSRTEQETARKKLVSIGVLEESREGMPLRLHYKVNFTVLRELLLGAKISPTSRQETCQQDGRKAPSLSAGNLPTTNIRAETTTETTNKEVVREFVEAWNSMDGFLKIEAYDRLDLSPLSDPRWRDALKLVESSEFYRGEGRQLGMLTAGQFLSPKIFKQLIAAIPVKVESSASKAEKAAFKKIHGVPRYLINQALQVGVSLDPKTGKWSDGGAWYQEQLNPPKPTPNRIQIGIAESEGVIYKNGEWSDGGVWWEAFTHQ